MQTSVKADQTKAQLPQRKQRVRYAFRFSSATIHNRNPVYGH